MLCLATLAPETLGGADVTGGRLDDVNQLAGAAARMLQPMVAEGIARTIPRVAATRRGARESLWRLLSSRSDRFDLGSADLRTARGLTAARQLSAGYRALANVNLLRQLLPAEGPASRGRGSRGGSSWPPLILDLARRPVSESRVKFSSPSASTWASPPVSSSRSCSGTRSPTTTTRRGIASRG